MNTIKKYQKFIDEVIVKVDEFTLMEMGNDIMMLKGFVSEIAQRMQGAGMVLSGGMRFG
jgi:translation elongation factor EF-Ts